MLRCKLLFRLAAAAVSFTLGNDLLIVTGALVGSSGAIFSFKMCNAMNCSFVSIILGGSTIPAMAGSYCSPTLALRAGLLPVQALNARENTVGSA